MNRLIHYSYIAILSLCLSACLPQQHSPESHTSKKSQDSAPTARLIPSESGLLPTGAGGHQKIGKPYLVEGKTYTPIASAKGYDATGRASWYGKKFHGKRTANGEVYDMYSMSAAHKTLPLPCLALVTNLDNGRSVIVRINDRGPFVKSRLIDLSYAAAKALGYDQQGTAHVRVQTLDSMHPPKAEKRHQQAQIDTPIPTQSDGHIRIQVAAFYAHEGALRLHQRLHEHHYQAHIINDQKEGRPLYRIQLGPYRYRHDAEQQLKQLQAQGYHGIIIE